MGVSTQVVLAGRSPDSQAICDLISRFKYNFHDETTLQDGIEAVLVKGGISYQREFRLNRTDRPDFLLDGGLAVEVKIQGSLSQLLRQASRYLLDDQVSELIVVGTPHWIHNVPGMLHDKSISKVRLLRSMF